MGRTLFSSWSSYIMLAMMLVSVGYVYLLHKKNAAQAPAGDSEKETSQTK